MPEALVLLLAVAVLGAMLVALVRVLRGPTGADRMSAALLLGSGGVAVLLLLAQAYGAPALRDVALVLALLAAVSAIGFVRMGAGVDDADGHDPGDGHGKNASHGEAGRPGVAGTGARAGDVGEGRRP